MALQYLCCCRRQKVEEGHRPEDVNGVPEDAVYCFVAAGMTGDARCSFVDVRETHKTVEAVARWAIHGGREGGQSKMRIGLGGVGVARERMEAECEMRPKERIRLGEHQCHMSGAGRRAGAARRDGPRSSGWRP